MSLLGWLRAQRGGPHSAGTAPAALLGVWHLLASDALPHDESEVEFCADGRMTYAIRKTDSWQVAKLTFRVEGDVITSNQPSSPREERTRFTLESDGTLTLELHGERSRYSRGDRRVPVFEH